MSDARKDCEVNKQKLKSRPGPTLGDGMGGMDQEIAVLKYNMWKPKMTCGSCTERGNDVEIFLPCGHMLCMDCLTSLKKGRSRACPFDRQKFTENEP